MFLIELSFELLEGEGFEEVPLAFVEFVLELDPV